MIFFLAGVVLLIVVVLLARHFVNANPATLAKNIRSYGGGAALVLAAVFLLVGQLALATTLAGVGMMLLVRSVAEQRATRSPGSGSEVETPWLRMHLDHDSGRISGEVRQGAFAGRRLETLDLAELMDLGAACSADDPQSAQLLEAYLDRQFPGWRQGPDAAGADAGPGAYGADVAGSSAVGAMTVGEALEVLGLEAGATPDDIRKAHRNLMKRFHPDQGGSGYIARKLNEAKDVLLAQA